MSDPKTETVLEMMRLAEAEAGMSNEQRRDAGRALAARLIEWSETDRATLVSLAGAADAYSGRSARTEIATLDKHDLAMSSLHRISAFARMLRLNEAAITAAAEAWRERAEAARIAERAAAYRDGLRSAAVQAEHALADAIAVTPDDAEWIASRRVKLEAARQRVSAEGAI